ncbi:hypothetical protein IAU59_000124 [Kwoniella sp. CBS 9459]
MFSTAANPYDELIVKATDENLASEDWALNMEVCDKVGGEGPNGARQAVAALQKRLSHRNPNVQLYALELANTLAQNCDKELLGELSSRNWTSALDRLINDRATAAPVKKKALLFVKAWAKQLEDTGDPNLGLMGELYDQLRAKNFTFDEPEAAPEDAAEARRRQEEEELARVLELSKQDKGGRNAYQPYQPSAPGTGGSSSSGTAAPAVGAGSGSGSGSGSSAQPYQSTASRTQPQQAYQPPAPVVQEPEPDLPLDINTATRVRALYTFTSAEVGELNFERGDVIKVLDRGFKEWWRGACNGQIGIFPVTYVEAMPEPSPRELQEEAQEEARVFASLGLVDQLLQTLKSIDPSRGDRLDDRPEIEEMYQASVSLQGQINALIKKYSDQKAELEHMNANFVRALRQYEELRNPPPMPAAYGYSPQAQAQPQTDPYAQAYQQHQYPQQAQLQPPLAQPAYVQQPQPQPQQSPQPQPQYAQQPQQYTAEPHPHQYATETQPHVQYPSQHPNVNPAAIGNGLPSQPVQAFPQAQPHHGAGSGSSAGGHPEQSFGQPFQYAQRAVSSTSINRVPTAAPGLPPNDLPRQNTEPGVAGLGAGSDPQAEHKAAWDAYYRQQAEHQQQQQYGGLPHQQGPEGDGTQNVYGQSPYAPQQGQPGVDGVTSGMNRMTVHGA